jgi:carbamoylphosphate synthase large subunit
MTLSDEAYQELRDAAIAVIRAVGVETAARTSSSRATASAARSA